jgi:acetylornithine deacetylase/succinyl-diaminopimelate desuccinylase-like protein
MLAAALLLIGLASLAGSIATDRPASAALREQLRAQRIAARGAILQELRALLCLPNVATNDADIRRNAALLVQMLQRRDLSPRLLEIEGGPPAVFGEFTVRGAKRTVVFYAHYDGQPVVASEWTSDPWTPVLRDKLLEDGGMEIAWPAVGAPATPARRATGGATSQAGGGTGGRDRDGDTSGSGANASGANGAYDDGEYRLYARSASDDKGPILALLASLDALRAARIQPSVNVKLFLEGEEEQGSPHLHALLEKHRAILAADAWIFCDGPVDPTHRHQVVFGVRGVMGLELTVYGPARPLHSGHYGNWAPNPIATLADLLASLRSPDGRILIEGFYDDVLQPTDAERRAIAALPDAETGLRQELALGRTEGGGQRLPATLLEPALNFRGVQAGGVGEHAANQIPSEARASIDFRLVPNQTPERVRLRVETYLRGLGFHVVHEAPDAQVRSAHQNVVLLQWEAGYPAYRCAMDLPVSRAVVEIVGETLGEPALQVPTLGGSLPLSILQDVVQVPLITVPIVNHDNRQHAANENLRLQNLWDGIDVYAALMAELGKRWN